MLYDPPEGWKYGFPKEYKPLPGETVADTLRRDGYPEKLMELAPWTRFIGTDEELKTIEKRKPMQLEITHATDKGMRRYQEDRYVTLRWLVPGEAILAVFDGHGGDQCAEYCASKLPGIVEEVGELFSMSKVFEILHKRTKEFHSGCAASIARINEEASIVEVGILGDAPVFVKQANGEL